MRPIDGDTWCPHCQRIITQVRPVYVGAEVHCYCACGHRVSRAFVALFDTGHYTGLLPILDDERRHKEALQRHRYTQGGER